MTIANDLFTDTNGTALESHTADSGATWTKHSASAGGATINSNKVSGVSNATLALYYSSVIPASADYDVQADITFTTAASALSGIAGRIDPSAATLYFFRYSGATGSGQYQLYKTVAGTSTLIGSYNAAESNGVTRTLRLSMYGSVISAWIDGVQRIAVIDSAITAAGRPGLRIGNSNTLDSVDNWSVTNVIAPTTMVSQADLWYNVRNNSTDNPPQTCLAEVRFTCTIESGGGELSLTGTTTAWDQGYASMTVFVDGTPTDLSFTTAGRNSFNISLAAGAHSIIIRNGPQTDAGGATVLGTFISYFALSGSTAFSLTPPGPIDVVVFGDSIAAGFLATVTQRQGYVALLRDTYGIKIACEAWGARALHDTGTAGTPDAALSLATLASLLASYGASTICMEIGTNDWNTSAYANSGAWQTKYASLISAIQNAAPSARLIAQSMTVRNSETGSGQGSLGSWRTAMAAAASGAGILYNDGSVYITTDDLNVDGVHPTTTGHAKYANRAAPAVSPTGFTSTAPTTGEPGEASDNGTVTIAAGATFTGDQTITITSDNGSDTITPSVGDPGVGSVTVTPTNGATSFTYTVTRSAAGTSTLTFTNAQGWTNPDDVEYVATTPTSLINTPPTSGTAGVASGNGTIDLIGTTFNGARTVTITSDNAGDVITPSMGDPGMGSVIVTPTADTNSFTYTIKRPTAGTSTLTVTNSFGATNPDDVEYEAVAVETSNSSNLIVMMLAMEML
jgi:lysophospholipase L1-like esterase